MNDLVRFDHHLPQSAVSIRTQVNLIQEVMHAVMKEGTHYGKIPGTPKPSLWKPGAEVLCTTFHIAPSYKVEDLSNHDCVRYRVTCVGTHQATSIVMGEGVGECSTGEEKYKWRRAASDMEFDRTPEDRRRIKYGFNSQQNREFEAKQVRTEPADLANTVLKMAAKRAQVAMTLNVTAASDIFTQDIEDLPEGLQSTETEGKTEVRKPRSKKDAKGAPPAQQAGQPAGEQQSGAQQPADGKVSEGQQRILKARLEGAQLTDEQFKTQFGVALAELPAARFNDVAAWVRDMTEARAE
jgi:hypothetical protein